jgi:NhaA family Na+:H+ antiporter
LSAHPGRTLLRPIDRRRDHTRGGGAKKGLVTVVLYGDYLCPYCRQLRPVLERLRQAMGQRLLYVFRHFPNERAHPGSTDIAIAAEAAARQGRFWEMHDALYTCEPPLDQASVRELARKIGLDMARFERDLKDPKLRARVDEDLKDGRRNHVTATPTLFVDGVRYDGAWDFYSMLEQLQQPVGARLQRTARAFANLPASAGLVLLAAAALALALVNSPLASTYDRLIGASIGIGPSGGLFTMTVAEWCSEGLLAIFFLIIGLELRREVTAGSLSDPRAAAAPVLAAVAGVVVPAIIYLALNPGPTSGGWSVPADSGIAFSLGILALFGRRASAGLKVFIASYAIADDLISILIMAVFYNRGMHAEWLVASAAAAAALVLLNRWRIYAGWPYLVAVLVLWLTLHLAGVNAALAGVVLAVFLPTRPTPSAAPLLAQAATALAELEQAEREVRDSHDETRSIEQEPVWDWASRNLSAAAGRLLSPAERIERALAPWSSYVALPLFAFTAAGVPLSADLGPPGALRVLWGVALGLAIGKPLGVAGGTWLAARVRLVRPPDDATPLAFLGAACLCGIGDPISILMAEQAFAGGAYGPVAKLGVLVGSAISTVLGVGALSLSSAPATPAAESAIATS